MSDKEVFDKKIIDEELNRLAGLSILEYELERDEKAKDMGMRASALDKIVSAIRMEKAEDAAEDVVEELSPWGEPVDGDALLSDVVRQITSHTVMQAGCPTAAAVWCMATFCIDGFRVFPKLQIKSPEKRCGKSTLMECIEGVVSRPLLTTNITASALFRCIEAWKPTLLIDEADTFARDNDELNGIINAGHTRRTATVIRSVKDNDDHKPKKFCVWGAQVIAGIKNQRDTLEDRSICINMRRKMPSETVTKIPIDYFEQNRDLRQKCVRWAEDNIEALKRSTVVVPSCGNDRAQDNWFPLFAIAEIAGGNWLEKTLAAYNLIEALDPDKDDSIAIKLLTDIKTLFDESGRDRLHSDDIVNQLIKMDDRPWPEWKRGFPMTKKKKKKLLKPHKIKSRQLKVAGTNLNGYELEAFQDAFRRYLPTTPHQDSTSLQSNAGAGSSDFQNSTENHDNSTPLPQSTDEGREVEFREKTVELQKALKPSVDAGCREVELPEGGNGERAYPEGLLDAA